MGWTSYYVGSKTNKECVLDLITHFRGKMKKMVQKGSSFYFLMETEKGEDWVLLMLTSKKNGEFYYKDVQCNPYESGVPLSILKAFNPSDEADAKWKAEQIEKEERFKDLKSFDFGDVLKIRNDSTEISWSNGHKIEAEEEFFIRIDVLNRYAKKRTKSYTVVYVNGASCISSGYRISKNTFDRLVWQGRISKMEAA